MSGLYPRCVLDAARRTENLGDGVAQQLLVLVCHQHDAPGQLGDILCNVVGALGGNQVVGNAPADDFLDRKRGEGSVHRIIGSVSRDISLQEIHTWIVLHIRLHQYRLLALGQTNGKGREGKRVLEHLGKRSLVVVRLEGIAPALTVTGIVYIRHKGTIVAGKAIFRSLAHHLINKFLGNETIGCGIVENPELHIISLAGKE